MVASNLLPPPHMLPFAAAAALTAAAAAGGGLPFNPAGLGGLPYPMFTPPLGGTAPFLLPSQNHHLQASQNRHGVASHAETRMLQHNSGFQARSNHVQSIGADGTASEPDCLRPIGLEQGHLSATVGALNAKGSLPGQSPDHITSPAADGKYLLIIIILGTYIIQ